jgi:hypothetical protein
MAKDHGPSVKNDKAVRRPTQERHEQAARGPHREHLRSIKEGGKEVSQPRTLHDEQPSGRHQGSEGGGGTQGGKEVELAQAL